MTDREPPAPGPPLPGAVRDRVVALAASALGQLEPTDVPPTLRAVARFTPAKRARLAAGGLAAALEADEAFRAAVAEHAGEHDPAVAAAVADGVPLPAAPPELVGALAYLLRPAGWQGRLAAAAEQLAARDRVDTDLAAVAALRGELAAEQQRVRAMRSEVDAARSVAATAQAAVDAARAEVTVLRRRLREMGEQVAAAERAAAQRAAAPAPESAGELRRLRARVVELEATIAAARSAGRDERRSADVRLRVLVDALVRAAQGLRTELALPPLDERPADEVVSRGPGAGRGAALEEPVLLDAVLCAPGTHLLVDGYNVTKSGYGEQTLQVQRHRLLTALAALAARTGAETTVVFDGVDRTSPLAAAAPRGVRLLFSRTGQKADDVLRDLVRAEPPGRSIVVVTSDREVVDNVRDWGARTAPSGVLLRLLDR